VDRRGDHRDAAASSIDGLLEQAGLAQARAASPRRSR